MKDKPKKSALLSNYYGFSIVYFETKRYQITIRMMWQTPDICL